MKQILIILFSLSALAVHSQQTQVKNIDVLGWFKFSGIKFTGVGTDSTSTYGSGTKLITERAAKAYARLAAVTYGGGGGGSQGGIGKIADNIVSTDNPILSGAPGSCLRLRAAITAAGIGGAVFVASNIDMHDSTATLLAGQTIFGYGATIRSSNVGSMSYSGMFHCLKTAARNKVIGINFIGAGYSTFRSDWYYTPQNAIQLTDSSSLVTMCSFYGFSGAGIIGMYSDNGGVSFKNLDNNKIINNNFKKCAVGVYDWQGGNYQIITNNTFDSCYINILLQSANSHVTNNLMDYGHIGVMGEGGPLDRGSISSNKINHNDTALYLGNLSYGYMVNDNTIFHGAIYLRDCDQLTINGGLIATNNTITVSGSGITPKTVLFANYIESAANTFNPVGTGKIIRVGEMTPMQYMYRMRASVQIDDTLRLPNLILKALDTSLYKITVADATGNIFKTSWPVFGSGGSSALSAIIAATGANSINNGSYKQRWDWYNAANFDSGFSLKASPSSFNSFVGRTFDVTMSGNSGATIESSYASSMTNNRTGSNLTNVALELRASNGADNYGLIVPQGKVTIGGSFGSYTFNVTGTSSFSSDVHVPNRPANDSTDIAANTAFVDRAAQTAAAQAVHDSSQTVYSSRGNKITITADADSVAINAFVHVAATASSATITPNVDTTDMYTVTALATNVTFAAPTGTPHEGQSLLIRIKDDGTSRTITWNSIYRAGTDFALPTATIAGKETYLQLIWNGAAVKYDAVGLTKGF